VVYSVLKLDHEQQRSPTTKLVYPEPTKRNMNRRAHLEARDLEATVVVLGGVVGARDHGALEETEQ